MGPKAKSAMSPFTTTPDLFVSTAKEKERVKTLQDEVKAIIQACYPELETLLATIESMGLPVISNGPEFQIKLSLMLVGGQPGFIPPTLPRYAEFVDAMKTYQPEKASMDFSNGLLLLTKNTRNFTFLAYQFYHALAFQNGLDGYQHTARKLYDVFNRKYGGQLHPKFLENLDQEETAQLRLAIRRDREALQFIRQILNEIFIPANNGKLLDSGNAQA